jgi:DNA-binding NtrC family response regulator
VERDRFRRDLYFRLAVILLRLPPLRERGEDVLILAAHYLRRFSAKYGKDVRRLGPEARQLMLSYPWPGNVRELSHVIERAVLWSKGQELGPDHLSLTRPVEAAEGRTEAASETVSGGPPIRPSAPTAGPPVRPSASGMTLDQWERSLLEQALRDSAGNQTRAAQQLGISRDTLRYRMKKYGIGGAG